MPNGSSSRVKFRYRWYGTISALFVIVSTYAVWGYLVYNGIETPLGLKIVITTISLMAGTWSFGYETLKAVQAFRGREKLPSKVHEHEPQGSDHDDQESNRN